MVKPPSKSTIFIVFLAASIVTALVVWTSFRTKEGSQPIQSDAATIVEERVPTETNMEYLSPDGKAKLILTSVSSGENIKQTVYFSLLSDEKKETKIYTKDSNTDDYLVVPFNVFSPDNKYIYLENKTSDGSEYYVLRTDGKDMIKENKFVTIVDRFTEKYPDLIVTDVTGWGGFGLLVVNTNTADGSLGPSFWFDLSNFGFIHLTNRFN